MQSCGWTNKISLGPFRIQAQPVDKHSHPLLLVSQDASHAAVAIGRGALRLPSLASVFNQAEEIPNIVIFLKKECRQRKNDFVYTLSLGTFRIQAFFIPQAAVYP